MTDSRPPRGSRGHAVVLGAGMAGLLAARVTAEFFDRVTIIERDDLTTEGTRRGVAQGSHLHALTERGRLCLEELFPGFTDTVTGHGAPRAHMLVETRWYVRGRRLYPTDTGLTSLLASRPLLESVLREAVLARSQVRLLQRVRAVGLVGRPGPGGPDEPGRIVGVRVERLDSGPRPDDARVNGTQANGTRPDSSTWPGGVRPADAHLDGGEVIEAELVVDATGRGSRAADWLAAHGLPVPVREQVDVDLGYASRVYRRRASDLDGQRAVIISTIPGLRGGGAVAQEDDRWIVTLAGMLGEHPPTDPDGFARFAATLPAPDIARLIADAEPLGDPTPYRFRGSVRRPYARLREPSAGFVALGDAVCSLNPLYAQGMTVAAQQALALRDALRDTPDALGPPAARTDADLPRRFFTAAAVPADLAWALATGNDLGYPQVQGRRTPRIRLVNAYLPHVHAAAHTDPVVARVFMRIINLVEPPSALLRPDVLTRVLRARRS
ncbi:FAD-dependent oxidoreductase [Frankia sp. B2]|nr:FAD-dependent oxidoreductase [Frankia sp. B2]